MALANDAPELRSAHVIVVGNEKGGTGKSTLSIHVVALLKAGEREVQQCPLSRRALGQSGHSQASLKSTLLTRHRGRARRSPKLCQANALATRDATLSPSSSIVRMTCCWSMPIPLDASDEPIAGVAKIA
jgi:hypothetical protein